MALVTTATNEIGDIAFQTKSLDEQIKEYQRGIQQMDREIGDTQKEKGLLETAIMLADLQKNKLQVVDRLNASRPDPEVAAKLQDLRNQLKMLQKKGNQADSVKSTTWTQYEKKKGRLEELHQQLEETKAKTNWAQLCKGHHQDRDYLGQENRLRELKANLKKMEEEQSIQQQITQRKIQLIDQLTKRKKELEEAEETLRDLEVQIKDAEDVKADREDEFRTLNRIFMKKESLIKNLQKDSDQRDPKNIKALESDKKVLQYEITKHSASRRSNDKTIQAQYFRLKNIESKLQAYAFALKRHESLDEDELARFRPHVEDPTSEFVDIGLFDAALQDLQDAHTLVEQKDLLMLREDASIEVLERKVEILTNARGVLLKKRKQETFEKEREKKSIEDKMEDEERIHSYQKKQMLDLYME